MSNTETDVLATLEPLMRDIFDEYEGPITPQTSAADIPQWDSLANVQLVVMIEQAFGMRFAMSEIENAKVLNDLLEVVAQRRSR